VTKFVGESLVYQASKNGLSTLVIRPGYVGPHSQTGAYNTNGMFSRLLRAFLSDGVCPSVPVHAGLDITPVDIVSASIASLSVVDDDKSIALDMPVFSIVSAPQQVTWSTVLQVCQEKFPELKTLPHADWWEQIEEKCQLPSGGRFHPLAGAFHAFKEGLPAHSPFPSPRKWQEIHAKPLPLLDRAYFLRLIGAFKLT
jgi:thioester reductase-like protein